MLPTLDLTTLKSADIDGSAKIRGLIRIGRRILQRCWLDQEVINQKRIFCQNSGACGSTYIVKLLNENRIDRVFHEKTPDLNWVGLKHYETPLPVSRLVRVLRYTRHDSFFEANNRLFSLSREIAMAFPNAQFIHLHRDGSQAVRSAMSKPDVQTYLDENIRFKGSLAGPCHCEPFIRLCHHWANMNRRIFDDLKSVSRQSGQKPISLRFEDLVNGRVKRIEEILGRSLQQKTCQPANVGRVREAGKFPAYRDWTRAHKSAFDEICGPVMSLLGR